MSGKKISFDDKKKSDFCKNKNIFQIQDTLLDIMVMMLLDNYLLDFHK